MRKLNSIVRLAPAMIRFPSSFQIVGGGSIRRRNWGLTLVEVLVVVAIVLLLVSIALPAYMQAKRKSLVSDDVNRLHQLAIAGSLYFDAEEHWPMSAMSVVTAGLAPSSVACSKLDPTKDGITNEIIKWETKNPLTQGYIMPAPYKLSFVGLGDLIFDRETTEKQLAELQNPGWLISFFASPDLELDNPYLNFGKAYLRLCNDGSVVRRSSETLDSASAAIFCYGDATDAWKRDYINH